VAIRHDGQHAMRQSSTSVPFNLFHIV